MGKITIECTCSKCGNTFEYNGYCKSKDRDNYVSWIKNEIQTCPDCYVKERRETAIEEAKEASVNSVEIPVFYGVYKNADTPINLVKNPNSYNRATKTIGCYFPKDTEEMIALLITREPPYPTIETAREVVSTRDTSLLGRKRAAEIILKIYDKLKEIAEKNNVPVYTPEDYAKVLNDRDLYSNSYRGATLVIAKELMITEKLASILLGLGFDGFIEEFNENTFYSDFYRIGVRMVYVLHSYIARYEKNNYLLTNTD